MGSTRMNENITNNIIPDQQLAVRKKSDIIEEWPASKSNFNAAMIEINFTTGPSFLCKYTTIELSLWRFC